VHTNATCTKSTKPIHRVDPSREVPTETDLAKCLELKHQTLISSAIEESTKMARMRLRDKSEDSDAREGEEGEERGG